MTCYKLFSYVEPYICCSKIQEKINSPKAYKRAFLENGSSTSNIFSKIKQRKSKQKKSKQRKSNQKKSKEHTEKTKNEDIIFVRSREGQII